MREMTIPFSLFDFFAVLLPGGIGLLGLYMFANPTLSVEVHQVVFSKSLLNKIDGDFAIFTLFVIASYLMGHILNALSELLIDKPANRIFGRHIASDFKHATVMKVFKQEFGEDIFHQQYRQKFVMVESVVGKNMPDAVIIARRFIAMAVMFESLALSTIIVLTAVVKCYFLKNFVTLGLL